MIFVASIIGIFVAISIYFFFRAETLQREVLSSKRETKITLKENKVLVDSMALLTNRYEEFAKKRLVALKESKSANEEQLVIITPLINHYALITTECLKGKSQLVNIVAKCYQSADGNSYKEFTSFINRQDQRIQRMWSSNHLKGYVALVEELLVEQEKIATQK